MKNTIPGFRTLRQLSTHKFTQRWAIVVCGGLAACLLAVPSSPAQTIGGAGFLPNPIQIVSTVPQNGDVNPYGVAFVPVGFPGGTLNAGDILVSNFNNSQNLQGTGTTIVRVRPTGQVSLFFTAQASQPGLSTALGLLKEGLIIVGNFPSTDGTCQTAGDGNLLVINSAGQQVQTITDHAFIDGPWDMTLFEASNGTIYAWVTNGLTGTVTRLNLQISGGALNVLSKTTIASGYLFQCDPVTFVDAPTGLVYDPANDLLYVASTLDNTVFAVSHAAGRTDNGGTGQAIYRDAVHLHGPLGMAAAPNGDLLVSNNDAVNPDPNQPSEIVEFTPAGVFVKQLSVDPNQGGSFGLNVQASGHTARFAAVDDNTPSLDIWTLPQ